MRKYREAKVRLQRCASRKPTCCGKKCSRFSGQLSHCRENTTKPLNSDHICNIVNAAMASTGAGTGPFDRFLNWLSPDRDEAVKEYEKIRKNITRYFIR